MINHIKINNQFFQTNKQWSALKESQKEKISIWMREETADYYKLHQKYPMCQQAEDVVDNVYDKIQAADIWIPYSEVYNHYIGKKTNIINQLEKKPYQKKVYLDKTDPFLGCTTVFSSEAEIIPVGTTVSSMPVFDKNEEYASLADTRDIHFIFDDNIPVIVFFTVPYIDIFAYVSFISIRITNVIWLVSP